MFALRVSNMIIPSDRPATVSGRFALLDLLRYVAAMMVALMHIGIEVGNKYNDVYSVPLLGYLIKNGAFGVDIFFIISGFVIIETAQRKNTSDFLIARFTRLFPGLLISMAVILVIGSHFIRTYPTPLSSFINSIFLTYPVTGVEPLTTQLWTLVYEIKFYGIVGVLLLLKPSAFTKRVWILIALVAWQLAILRLSPPTSPGLSNEPLVGFFASWGHIGNLFALGICLNFVSQLDWKSKYWTIPVLGVSVFFVWKTFFLGHYQQEMALCLGVFSVLIFISNKIESGKTLGRIAQWFGLSSYLIYLLHEQVALAFFNVFQKRVTGDIAVTLVATTAFITFVGIVLALFVERPLQGIAQRFLIGLSLRLPQSQPQPAEQVK